MTEPRNQPGRTGVGPSGTRTAVPGGLLFCLLLLAPAPDSADAQQTLEAIDLFGTDQITAEQVRSRLGDTIRAMVRTRMGGDRERARAMYDRVRAGIHEMGAFAYVELALVNYPERGGAYLTVDVVDESDREERMSFSPAPTDDVPDPGGLLAAWREYERTGLELLMGGEISSAPDCAAHHCLWGFDHPSLAPYRERFEAVPEHRDELVRVLREDRDAEDRAAAAYLLAHLTGVQELVDALVPSISDPDETVRNNAMRVLGIVVNERPGVELDLEPVLRAVRYPATTDRNKAMLVLFGVAGRPELQDRIVRGAGPVLLEALRLRQPNNHDTAYLILRRLSGETFGERDYEAWRRWLEERR